MITVYMVCKDEGEAKQVASRLLEKRLIACANIFPVRSMFRWEGNIRSETEAAMFCKAKEEDFELIKEETKQVHSYEIPCIVALPWKSSEEEYEKWVAEETTGQP